MKVYYTPARANERLMAAVYSAEIEGARGAIGDGADVNVHDRDTGLTPLMLASGKADTEMVRLLLDAGADVFTTDGKAGATALHKACQGGNLEVVRELVSVGAFVNAVAPTTGHTPLMEAIWYKQPAIVKYLLELQAGVNLSTHYGFSLTEHFDYELNVTDIGKERQLLAARYLADRRAADEARASAHQLMMAVTRGDARAVSELLARGTDVDERYPIVNGFNDAHTPLLVAARDGHAEITRLLLEAGADVNATEPVFGAVPLHKAVYNGHAEITRIIASWPLVDINFQGHTNGYTPLHDAIWHGYAECSQILLDAGADTRLCGHDGKAPGDLAAEIFGAGHPLTRRMSSMAAS